MKLDINTFAYFLYLETQQISLFVQNTRNGAVHMTSRYKQLHHSRMRSFPALITFINIC